MSCAVLYQRLGRWCRSESLAGLLAFGLQGCAASLRRAPSLADSLVASRQLGEVTDDYWQFLRVSRPDVAVRADSTVAALPDPTQDRAKGDAQFAREGLAQLDEIFVEALTEDDYVTWLSMRWEMEALGGWTAYHWTNLTDLSPGRSVFDRSIEVLRAQRVINLLSAQRYIALVSSVGDVARDIRRDFEERATRDIRLPRQSADRAAAHVRSLIAPAAESPFAPPRDTLALSARWRDMLDSTTSKLIEEKVNPLLDSLATFLEMESSRTDAIGLSGLAGGTAHYGALLRYRSTLNVTVEDAHAIGLREVARIAALAGEARREAGLPVNRDSLRAKLASDSMFVLDDRVSVAELTASLFEQASKTFDSLFKPVPTLPLSIAVLPTDAEAGAPLATYEGATLAMPAARYLLNTLQLERRSAFVLPGLVLADLMPGLHLQRGTQFENMTLPRFRWVGSHDGFVKGWQMYVLEIADSVSGALTPWQRFGVRMRELAAACGLVVDTGINAAGWSRADALEFLRAYLPDSDDDLERDFIVEAVEAPASLAGATLGARELRGLRRWAMRELGDRFSAPAFHREILRVGSVPLPVLGSHLERWIWEQKNAAAPSSAVIGR